MEKVEFRCLKCNKYIGTFEVIKKECLFSCLCQFCVTEAVNDLSEIESIKILLSTMNTKLKGLN